MAASRKNRAGDTAIKRQKESKPALVESELDVGTTELDAILRINFEDCRRIEAEGVEGGKLVAGSAFLSGSRGRETKAAGEENGPEDFHGLSVVT